MNAAGWHLAVNHVPVIAMPFAVALLAVGFARRSQDLTLAGYATLIVAALSAFASLRTGGPAAGMVHALPGVVADAIRPHARAAKKSAYVAGLLGLLGVAGLTRFKGSRRLALSCAAGALLASAQLAWVAHLGGLVRHPELQSEPVQR